MKKYLYLSAIFIPIMLILFYSILLSFDIKKGIGNLLIPKGSTVSSVADSLYHKKYFSKKDINIFKLIMKLSFKENKIYAAEYDSIRLKELRNMNDLVDLITSDPGTKITLTFIEGWGVKDYASKLHNSMGIDSLKFIELCENGYIEKFGIQAPSCEGYLYPNTYDFLKFNTEEQIFDRLIDEFLKQYNNFIKDKGKSNNMSMNEIVTLASIIQGEAAQRFEMNMISSVYHNRLKIGMKLEADPTIQYIIPGKNKRLLFRDLDIVHTYNTYLHRGLPPGPISNPGLSALMAAINPEKSEYLYFVSDTEGGHMFSETLKNHKKNIKIFKRKRRQKKQK